MCDARHGGAHAKRGLAAVLTPELKYSPLPAFVLFIYLRADFHGDMRARR